MTGHPGDARRPIEDDDEAVDTPVMVMAKPLDLSELLAILDEISSIVVRNVE